MARKALTFLHMVIAKDFHRMKAAEPPKSGFVLSAWFTKSQK
jgi:hypothetical protein